MTEGASVIPPPAGGTEEHAGSFLYPDRPPMPASVRVESRDRRARLVRAARTLGACWGLAVVAIFLPVLHFVLVPLLLVLGPALGWSRLNEAHSLLRASGSCPGCGGALELKLGQRWRERTMLRCPACGRGIELRLPAEPERG
ncbi:MAG TPA: hypothetical protein VMH61_08410 [Candidatus Acidoferrales bacterium]|nr:hypothetical protein [Candidatus Acidoferrales bacterium]